MSNSGNWRKVCFIPGSFAGKISSHEKAQKLKNVFELFVLLCG
jgi:hypothetical protein